MAPVKKPQKPSTNELATLDDAVSELSKQTEALLGKAGEKVAVKKNEPKPSLPKKRHTIPHKKGQHIDIISSPGKTKSASILKSTAAPPAVKNVSAPAMPLSHEAPTVEPPTATAATTKAAQPLTEAPLVKGHPAGSLQVAVSKPGTPPDELLPADGLQPDEEVDAQVSTGETDGVTKAKPKAVPEPVTEVPSNPESIGEEQPASEESDEDTINLHDTPTVDDTAVYANNLTDDVAPKGYQPHPNQHKPTVFDTNEYHLELHDWSKLEHSNRGSWLVLLLLVVAAGAGAYIFLLHGKLPF